MSRLLSVLAGAASGPATRWRPGGQRGAAAARRVQWVAPARRHGAVAPCGGPAASAGGSCRPGRRRGSRGAAGPGAGGASARPGAAGAGGGPGGPGPRPARRLGGSGWRRQPPAQLGRATGPGGPPPPAGSEATPPRPPGAPPTPSPPLVARSWRAVTPGQREAPTPTTSSGYARELRAARLSWTAPQWRPYTSPPTPTREGLRRPGVWGQSPHDPQQWAGSPAEPEWQPSATPHQRCVAMQVIAALTASWGERVFELAPHLTLPHLH